MQREMLKPGTHLQNRYQIEKLIAQGGMGAVYRARDLNLREKTVAIKENFIETEEGIKLFEDGAAILTHLHHNGLPRVTDYFSEFDRHYLVMDFIKGEDLAETLKRGPLAENKALDYLIQICEIVQYLHQQTPPIIHRDIKPGNIIITPKGKAMLVDFGIAGANVGASPGYSPPEQYEGRADARSDTYALGATLYTLLTGQIPAASTTRQKNPAVFIAPEQLNSALRQALSQAIQEAMDLESYRRPPVRKWQERLEEVVTGKKIGDKPKDKEIPKSGNKNRLIPVGIFGVGVMVLVTLLFRWDGGDTSSSTAVLASVSPSATATLPAVVTPPATPILTATPSPSPPATLTPTIVITEVTGQISGGGVIETGKGPQRLAIGTELILLARTEAADRLYVETHDQAVKGWVARKFVDTSGNLATLPVGTPPPTATPRPSPTATPPRLPRLATARSPWPWGKPAPLTN